MHNQKKEKCSIQMFVRGIPKRKVEKAQSLPNLLHSKICQKAWTFSFHRSSMINIFKEKKNPAQTLLLYFCISKTILKILSLDLALKVLFLPNISFNAKLTNYHLDQFVTTSLAYFNRSTAANRMVLQMPCQPSKSSPWTKNVIKIDFMVFCSS